MFRLLLIVMMLVSGQSYAAKYVKNTTGSTKTWAGQMVAAGVCHLVPGEDAIRWSLDDNLLIDLASGDALASRSDDCSTAITPATMAVMFLKGEAPVDSDGSPLAMTKITKTGWQYQHRSLELTTCLRQALVELEYDLTNTGFGVVTFWDAAGNELVQGGGESDNDFQTRLNGNCKKTMLDWTPTHDIQLIGGQMRQHVAPSGNVRMWVVGVPGIPAGSGGTKIFINNMNMKYLGTSVAMNADGRAPKELKYNDPVPGTNTMRFILIADGIGVQHSIHVSMELFKP